MLKVLDRSLSIGAIVVGFVLFSVAVASAQTWDIEGLYRVTGTNPGGIGEYRGEVAVARTGEVYQIAWRFGDDQHIGTGILLDGRLSVVCQPQGQVAGIAVYRIEPNGTLQGIWTTLGGELLGTEDWTPQGRT